VTRRFLTERGALFIVGISCGGPSPFLTKPERERDPVATNRVSFSFAPAPHGEVCVVEIQLGENDRLDWALKQFRRRMIRSGLFKDMRRKRFYEKPSEARKAKSKAAQRRRAKDRRNARRGAHV
jgi:small subunit ribosomal protein S21